MARIKNGSTVSTVAWRFDRKSVALEERWSYLQFRESWVDEELLGLIRKNLEIYGMQSGS